MAVARQRQIVHVQRALEGASEHERVPLAHVHARVVAHFAQPSKERSGVVGGRAAASLVAGRVAQRVVREQDR